MKGLAVLLSCFFLADARRLSIGPSVDALHRILGGEDAEEGKWPWQMGLYYWGDFICGATLIEREDAGVANRAITAGHCVAGRAAAMMEVSAGSYYLFDHTDQADVISYHLHYEWDIGQETFPNDIAVLYLSMSFNVDGDDIDTVARARPYHGDFVGSECYITGWGRTGTGDCCESYLKQAEARPIDTQDCQVNMDACLCGAVISDKHICLKDQNEVVGSCNGDSGSPLSCWVEDEPGQEEGKWVVAGISSWMIQGGGNCLPEYPSVYTRISSHEEWLDGHT